MGNWNDLLIKGVGDSDFKEGYSYYHVRMGSGFIDALECGLTLKDPIENDSRLEHGVRMMVNTKIAKRTLTLQFNIFGSTLMEYQTNKASFETMLQKGLVTIKVNDTNHINCYHLVYTGKSVTYKHSYNGKFGIFTAQFIEPNPSLRGMTPSDKVLVIT